MLRRLTFLVLSFLFAVGLVSGAQIPDSSSDTQPVQLFEIRLPEGRTGSINIGWFPDTKTGATYYDPNVWLSQGYDGVRFVGAGRDRTHIYCTSWDGNTIAVGRHNGIVEFRDLTVHSGYVRGAAFGEQNTSKTLSPGFRINLINVTGVVDEPITYLDNRVAVFKGGKGYRVGDVIRPKSGTGTPTTYRVDAVFTQADVDRDPNDQITPARLGEITRVAPHSRGAYTVYPPGVDAVTGGSGTGAELSLGGRPTWMWFGYNLDLYANGVVTHAKNANEHAFYLHGFASRGIYVVNCTITGSGAENFKVRSDTTETAWAGPGCRIIIKKSSFADWYQPWSWRGGGGIVLQGAAADVLIEECTFTAGGAIEVPGYKALSANDRCKAIMVSSEGESYDTITGQPNVGYGNGHVVIRRVAVYGNSDVEWRNSVIRSGRNGGAQWSARSFTLTESAVRGRSVIVQTSEIPTGKMRIMGCNTPELTKFFEETFKVIGVPEAMYPSDPRVPISAGVVR